MPHITLHYSGNIEDKVDTSQLLDSCHRVLAELETFDGDRIKSRALCHDTFRVGAGHEGSAFIHATVVFSRGRSDELRKQVGECLFMLLESGADRGDHKLSIARSVEIRQFEHGMYFRD